MDTPQAVTDARSNAARLGNVAADFAVGAQTIPDQLKKAVNEALNYNADIIAPRASALSDYFAAPAQANAKFGVQQFGTGPQAGQTNPDYIFNPFERNSAIQTFVTNQLTPFTMYNSLLGARQGSTADTINAGTNAFNAQAVAAQKAADAARQTYTDVLNEFTTTTQLGQEQQKINQSGAGGTDLSSVLSILQQLLGGQGAGNGQAQPGSQPDITAAYDYGPSDTAIENDNTSLNPAFDAVMAKNDQQNMINNLPKNVPLTQPNQNPSGLSLAGNNSAFSNLKSLNIKGLQL